MPDANVIVEAVLVYAEQPTTDPSTTEEEKVFTITFYDTDGSILSQKTYHYNEVIELPGKTPVKASDSEEYEYVFKSWDPIIIERAVEDAEYRPVFQQATKKIEESPYNSDQFFTKVILGKVLPLFLILCLVIGGAVAGIVLYVRKNKKKKKKNQ